MTWLVLAYLCVAYWYFRQTLKCVEAWDTWDTVLINATLALLIGPLLLATIPVLRFADQVLEH